MSERQDYCKEKSAPEGSSLYYATLYESEANKHLIFRLFAVHYELFDCLIASSDPGVTRTKLHWWHEELLRLSSHNPRHPVTRAILPTIKDHPFILDYLTRHYLTISSLLNSENPGQNNNWITDFSAKLGQLWMCGEKLTGNNDNESAIITNGGSVFILELLQNYYLLWGKLPDFPPRDLLEKHGLQQDTLKLPEHRLDTCQLFNEILTEILTALDTVYTQLKSQKTKPGLYHFIMNRLAHTQGKEILRDGSQIMSHKLTITPLRKLWRGWVTKLLY